MTAGSQQDGGITVKPPLRNVFVLAPATTRRMASGAPERPAGQVRVRDEEETVTTKSVQIVQASETTATRSGAPSRPEPWTWARPHTTPGRAQPQLRGQRGPDDGGGGQPGVRRRWSG
ncbi:hypothetical protein ANANG_G00073830 [Anguilla anguilla]|uniref:Uncharacterized protein n=1 Tax=Anguilla anguilla TaxID=7936 RepID=A0A9D3MSX6_ANGAN|nr:hypothetical protein ANANG_G00073830 [Anguilla anguilla]